MSPASTSAPRAHPVAPAAGADPAADRPVAHRGGRHDPARARSGAGERVLAVRDLSVDFVGDRGTTSAVDAVSFDLHAGEVLAVVGESGCGKSVTSMALGGLLPSSARVGGSVVLEGRELLGAGEARLRRVRGADLAYVFQEPMTSLNPVLTVGRQVAEVVRVHQGLGRAAARARAVELLDLVGIPSPARRVGEYPHQLSGGMRQRVMIAMAVACDPRVLVADEPTTALDVTVQAAILDLLRDLAARLGTGVVLITHDLGVVADVADRVVVMYAGRVVETAPVDDLFAAPRHHYTTGLLGSVTTAGRGTGTGTGTRRLREIPGTVPVLAEQPDACTFADRCTAVVERCRSAAPPLAAVRPAPDGPHGPDGPDGAAPDGATTEHRVACWSPATSEVAR